MAPDALDTASDLVESAADSVDGQHAGRLHALADQLDDLAAGDSDPDHGRLARIQRSLDDISDDVDDETADNLREADAEINAFRETLDGV